MRIRPAMPLLLALGLLAMGCSGSADQHVAVAEQADRVAELLDQDRTCEAAEALRTLEDLASDGTSAEVRDAVTTFVASSRSTVTCTSPDPTPPPAQEDEPAGGNGDEGRGNGKPDDGGPPEDRGRDDEDKDKDEDKADEGKDKGEDDDG